MYQVHTEIWSFSHRCIFVLYLEEEIISFHSISLYSVNRKNCLATSNETSFDEGYSRDGSYHIFVLQKWGFFLIQFQLTCIGLACKLEQTKWKLKKTMFLVFLWHHHHSLVASQPEIQSLKTWYIVFLCLW